MAQAQRKPVEPVDVALPPLPAARTIGFDDRFAASGSPVSALHERLLASFGSEQPRDAEKLPLAVRGAILIGSSLALWACVIAAGYAALA